MPTNAHQLDCVRDGAVDQPVHYSRLATSRDLGPEPHGEFTVETTQPVDETVVGADDLTLTNGWHAVEQTAAGAPWRWTSGDAGLATKARGPYLPGVTLDLV
jgi:hypothetical protein